MNVYIHIYIYKYIHTYIHVYTYIHTYIFLSDAAKKSLLGEPLGQAATRLFEHRDFTTRSVLHHPVRRAAPDTDVPLCCGGMMSIVLVQVHISEAMHKLRHCIMIGRTFSIVAEAMPRLQLVNRMAL